MLALPINDVGAPVFCSRDDGAHSSLTSNIGGARVSCQSERIVAWSC